VNSSSPPKATVTGELAKRRSIDPGSFPTPSPPTKETTRAKKIRAPAGKWNSFGGNTVEGEGVDGRVGDGDDGDAVCAHLHGGGAPRHLRRRRRRRQCCGAGVERFRPLGVTWVLWAYMLVSARICKLHSGSHEASILTCSYLFKKKS